MFISYISVFWVFTTYWKKKSAKKGKKSAKKGKKSRNLGKNQRISGKISF